MADAFISYRRVPSSQLAMNIQARLQGGHKLDIYLDVNRTAGTTVRFSERLMHAIEDAPVFICIMGKREGKHTLESDWVLREVQKAYDLGKFCIPVFQESYETLSDVPPAVDYLLSFDGVHILDQKNVLIDSSVQQIANLIRPHIERPRTGLYAAIIALFGAVIFIGILAFSAFSNGDDDNSAAGAEETQVVALDMTDTPEPTQTPLPKATDTPEPTQTPLPTATNTSESTQTPLPTATNTSEPTQTPLPTATDTPEPTQTPLPTVTPTPDPTAVLLASEPQSNAEWTPVEREFDLAQGGGGTVTMVFVPAGCFNMGSDDGDDDEQPIHEICIREPFWIDKTEVTNEDYGSVGCSGWSSEDDQPRNCVTWVEASEYCAARSGIVDGSRLPTEAEWEYAARGPDASTYAWGFEYDAALVIDANDPEFGNVSSAPVGSRPDGQSWVGAMDMSGNLWEWTRSAYADYQYDAEDGRENTAIRDVQRVLRGGSFSNRANSLRAASRINEAPDDDSFAFGFRCMRPVVDGG